MNTVVQTVLTSGLLFGFHYRRRLPKLWRLVYVALMIAIIAAFAGRDIQMIRANLSHPPKWDFPIFWLGARLAASGENFYNLEVVWQGVQTYGLHFNNPAEAACYYLPPAMLFFLPLGWFDMRTAHLLWYLVLCATLIADIILLWRLFFKEAGWLGLGLTAALVLTLNATAVTLYFGQTNFMVFLFFFLFWRERQSTRRGIWLGTGLFLKHWLGILALGLVWQRNWRALISMLLTMGAMVCLTLVLFGRETFFTYFSASHPPTQYYSEPMNQSLLATILRLTDYGLNPAFPLANPIFIILALLLTGATLWLISRLGLDNSDRTIFLVLALALLLYPATLQHYSFHLLAPMLWFWARRQKFVGGVYGAVAFITLEYALIRSDCGFAANALMWLTLAADSVHMLKQSQTRTAVIAA